MVNVCHGDVSCEFVTGWIPLCGSSCTCNKPGHSLADLPVFRSEPDAKKKEREGMRGVPAGASLQPSKRKIKERWPTPA